MGPLCWAVCSQGPALVTFSLAPPHSTRSPQVSPRTALCFPFQTRAQTASSPIRGLRGLALFPSSQAFCSVCVCTSKRMGSPGELFMGNMNRAWFGKGRASMLVSTHGRDQCGEGKADTQWSSRFRRKILERKSRRRLSQPSTPSLTSRDWGMVHKTQRQRSTLLLQSTAKDSDPQQNGNPQCRVKHGA